MSRARPTRIDAVIAGLIAHHEGASRAERQRGALVMKTFAAYERLPAPVVLHSEPVSLRAGVLMVAVDEAVWLTELGFLRAEMIERLNKILGRPVVKEIRLRQGKLTRKKARPPADPRPPPPLSPAKAAEVQSWVEGVADPALRTAIERAARWALGKKR
jgi:hypothetical protein